MLQSWKDKELADGSENDEKFSKIPYMVDHQKIEFHVFKQARLDLIN